MRQSKYFLKTSTTLASDETIVSAKLLKQAGYITESVAGRYYFLPIGHRVSQKIEQVVREEMDKVGAQEMIAPVLHPLELWKETNRTNSAGFELLRVKDRRGAEFALGGTAEEMFVDLVRKFTISYRELPFQLYQFSSKFRDEIRARGWLLRVREFVMKDGYSFHVDEEDFRKTYEVMKAVYTRIFARLGLKTQIVESDNGYIGGEYCHEFIADSPVGESRYFATADGAYAAHEDVAKFERRPVNAGAEMLPFQIIEQPEWVQTMEDNEKHYGKDKSSFLKNVVYKNRVTGEIIIAVVTGDLEVNQTKLESLLGAVGQLESATDEDLAKIGTKHGYVHCWGHKGVRYVGDIVLDAARNLIGGQKEDKTDSINVNHRRDFKCDVVGDIALAAPGSESLGGHGPLIERRGIEVGNVFQLGYHYTKLMEGALYTAEDGTRKPYYMGCYGIGLGRTLATVVETYHDEKGIVWPEAVAPFRVHLLALKGADGEALYEKLTQAGIEVLYDDRDEAPGVKFTDADLIGIPWRLLVSAKTGDKVEVKRRGEKEAKLMTVEEAMVMIGK